jgi:hypothetical protein
MMFNVDSASGNYGLGKDFKDYCRNRIFLYFERFCVEKFDKWSS